MRGASFVKIQLQHLTQRHPVSWRAPKEEMSGRLLECGILARLFRGHQLVLNVCKAGARKEAVFECTSFCVGYLPRERSRETVPIRHTHMPGQVASAVLISLAGQR